MRLGDLVVRFVADMGQWNTGVKQAQGDIDQTTQSTGNLGKETKATSGEMLILASTAAAAGYAVYAAAEKYGAAAQELKDLSYQTGASSDALQKLQYGAMLSGTDFGKVSFALNNVTLSMEAATDATSAQARAFKTLGIDPTGKTPTQVFDELTLALTKQKDESKRATLANDILGKSWKEILPFMADYIENKEKINSFQGYTKEELKNQESLKVAFDESVNSLDLFFGHWIARLGEVAKAQKDMEESQPSYLNQWLNNTFGDKSSAKSGAGGRSGPADMPKSQPLDPAMAPEVQAAREKVWKARQLYEKDTAYWIEQQADAEKDLLFTAQKILDVRKSEKELTGDFVSDLATTNIRDTAGVRSLTMGYNKNLKKLQKQESDLGTDYRNTSIRAFVAGKRDTDALRSNLSLNIQNVNLSKDYPIDEFIRDYEKHQEQLNNSMGVPKR